MKICIISPYFTPFVKGSEHGLAQKLTEFDHDVTILTSTSNAPREKMVIKKKYKEEYNFKVKYLASIDFYENPIAPSVFLHVLRGKYDVVMLREDYPVMCHLAYLAARITNTPLTLSTDRTYSLSSFTLKGIFLKILDCTINRIVRNNVDAYIAHCSSAKEFVIKKLKTNKDVKVIHIGVDTDFFKPVVTQCIYLKEGEFKILTIARLHQYKGLEYLIKAMTAVVKKHKDVKLYVKGKGPEEKHLKKMVEELGLSKHVIFLKEAIPGDKLPEFYSECDLYVQPSIIEPFGIAVLEAMACGKPVVGSKTGGMLDTIVDGVTGFSVPPGNSEELSRAIIKFIDDRTLLMKIGENARKEAQRYDWHVITRQYLNVMSEVLTHKSS
ncbi:MAG: glycosyltransferase family 4 protein [Candidatus Methanoperedens sp.]|nr:glycosyltransferase family 4 protein [Candidatus Methanoperedens sp.]MCZ7394917.1 glycosyltransferase family 4 protein [Candidatus Methanoperedens sp.]